MIEGQKFKAWLPLANKAISKLGPTFTKKRAHPLPRRFIKDIQKSMSRLDSRSLNAIHRDLRLYQRQHPNCVEGWLVLGDLESFGNKERALECFLNALLWDPVNPEAHMEVAKRFAPLAKSTAMLRFHVETALRNCRFSSDDWMWLSEIIRLADGKKGFAGLVRQAKQFLRIGFPDEYRNFLPTRKKRRKQSPSSVH